MLPTISAIIIENPNVRSRELAVRNKEHKSSKNKKRENKKKSFD